MAETFRHAVEAQMEITEVPGDVAGSLEHWPDEDLPRACHITAHTMHHDGAAAQDWQPWLGLAAWGCVLAGNDRLARASALVSHVYPAIADLLPTSVPVPGGVDYHALTHVLGLSPSSEPPALPDSERLELVAEGFDTLLQDDYFAMLADAITRRDWEAGRAALDQLAEIALEGRSPDQWNAELAPGYEPIPAALAAVAREAGFPLDRLAGPTRKWLWPAVESKPGILPESWPVGSS